MYGAQMSTNRLPSCKGDDDGWCCQNASHSPMSAEARVSMQGCTGASQLCGQLRDGGGRRSEQEWAAHPHQDILQPAESRDSCQLTARAVYTGLRHTSYMCQFFVSHLRPAWCWLCILRAGPCVMVCWAETHLKRILLLGLGSVRKCYVRR